MARVLSRVAAAFATLAAVAQASASPGHHVEEKFEQFVHAFDRSYASFAERAARLEVFAKNLLRIQQFQQDEEGSAVYSHLTPFADVSQQEFSQRLGLQVSGWNASRAAEEAEPLDVSAVPASIDWRTKGAVNPVKDQKACGSCWAFATVGNIEGAGFVTTGKLVSLSEQELVDCDHKTGNHGCAGGLPSQAYQDLIQSKFGLEREQAYPYKSKNDACTASKSKEVAFISGWKPISTDEVQIAAALVQYGPLALGINANPMQMYSGGIADPGNVLCDPMRLDHGVVFVGFGEQGKKFWTIRNSWGAMWGEQGYYRIVRGKGACGLNTMVTTATGITFQSLGDGLVVV